MPRWIWSACAREGHRRLVEHLLTRAEPRQKLLHFCWEADPEQARQLLEEHPGLVSTLPPRDMARIADAAWENRLESVRCMADAGFELEAVGAVRSTALDRAAFHGFAVIVEFLLSRGASVEAVNQWGAKPLECCVYGSVHSWRRDGDHPRAVLAFLKAGGRVNPQWIPSGNAAVDEVLRSFLPWSGPDSV